MTAFINRVTEQYKASDALVLPVEAQAARLAPIMRAWVNAADMPLSLKLPEGFIPSYCRNSRPRSRPTYLPTRGGVLQQRLPFADGDDLFRRGERQQFVEPPHAAKAQRIVPARPFCFEPIERVRAAAAGPSRRPRPAARRSRQATRTSSTP